MQHLLLYVKAASSEEIGFSSFSVIYITTTGWGSLERSPLILKELTFVPTFGQSSPPVVYGFQFRIIRVWANQGYSNQVLIFSMCWPKTRMKNLIQRGNLHVCKHNQCCWNIHRMKSWLLVVAMWSLYGVCIFCPAVAASKCVPCWEIGSHLLFTLLSFSQYSQLQRRTNTHTKHMWLALLP